MLYRCSLFFLAGLFAGVIAGIGYSTLEKVDPVECGAIINEDLVALENGEIVGILSYNLCRIEILSMGDVDEIKIALFGKARDKDTEKIITYISKEGTKIKDKNGFSGGRFQFATGRFKMNGKFDQIVVR